MKCVFVGSLKEDSGYIVEVLQEKEYEIIQAGEYDQIEKTINPVLESQAEIAVYDLLPLNDDPLDMLISYWIRHMEQRKRSLPGALRTFMKAMQIVWIGN